MRNIDEAQNEEAEMRLVQVPFNDEESITVEHEFSTQWVTASLLTLSSKCEKADGQM